MKVQSKTPQTDNNEKRTQEARQAAGHLFPVSVGHGFHPCSACGSSGDQQQVCVCCHFVTRVKMGPFINLATSSEYSDTRIMFFRKIERRRKKENEVFRLIFQLPFSLLHIARQVP